MYKFDDFKGRFNLDKFDSTWYKMRDKSRIKEMKKRKNDSGTRYCGVNLHSAFYRGTIEFRYHSGTLDPIKILKWTNILLQLVEYATKNYSNHEITTLYNADTSKAKLNYFCKIFRIRGDIKKYMRNRIDHFNPKFKKFNNKGYAGGLRAREIVEAERRRGSDSGVAQLAEMEAEAEQQSHERRRADAERAERVRTRFVERLTAEDVAEDTDEESIW